MAAAIRRVAGSEESQERQRGYPDIELGRTLSTTRYNMPAVAGKVSGAPPSITVLVRCKPAQSTHYGPFRLGSAAFPCSRDASPFRGDAPFAMS